MSKYRVGQIVEYLDPNQRVIKHNKIEEIDDGWLKRGYLIKGFYIKEEHIFSVIRDEFTYLRDKIIDLICQDGHPKLEKEIVEYVREHFVPKGNR